MLYKLENLDILSINFSKNKFDNESIARLIEELSHLKKLTNLTIGLEGYFYFIVIYLTNDNSVGINDLHVNSLSNLISNLPELKKLKLDLQK